LHWIYADRELTGDEVLALGFGYDDGRRLVFAGSDVSEHEPGWIEGALLSGAHAARLILARGA
jgi:hypothetical protein